MEISKVYLIVIVSFLLLSFVVAEFGFDHNIKTLIPPPPKASYKNLNFGLLPRYAPVPSSGPNTRRSDSPPPPKASHKNLNFGFLPKYVPIPPSGPNNRRSDSPLQPKYPYNN